MIDELRTRITGEVLDDDATLTAYSHDASLCEVRPRAVAFPKNADDVSAIVRFAQERTEAGDPTHVSFRSAGTCMSGGSLTEGIVVDVSKYITGGTEIRGKSALVKPGTFYRDFEKETLARDLILPCFTASKDLCALGGMIGNNCAGEKTLRYGKMENYVESLDLVLSDGSQVTAAPLGKQALDEKMSLQTLEGSIYRELFALVTKHADLLAAAKPKVSKNSAGYFLWNVWDGTTFDITKLIVGSQGTLAAVTGAKLRLVPVTKHSRLFVVFLRDLAPLSELVNVILEYQPESLESYDDSTMSLALRFLPEMISHMKAGNFFKLMLGFIPEAFMALTGGIPKLILLAEFSGDDVAEIERTMEALEKRVRPMKLKTHRARSAADSEKYWTIRHESFNLLRKHVRGRRTAPFIDDVVVNPEHLPEFLPKMRKILDDNKLVYTIAGHAGNGNFHIIPLMDMKDARNADLIMRVSDEVYSLVASYKGSITAEHNDGIIRTPYLYKMYPNEVLELFARVKRIFDPQGILNPGKKVGGSLDYFRSHIVKG
jgi:FAD/FMN-containing dehydrogenase